MIELLNELRVALPGVQILFAFLLTVPFTQRFTALTPFQRDTYYVTLIATALSTACLIAPSAAHRLRFHQGDRAWVIESANRLTIAGLVLLAIALAGSVLLITDVMFDGARVWIYTGAVWAVFLVLWFVRPLVRSARGVSSGPSPSRVPQGSCSPARRADARAAPGVVHVALRVPHRGGVLGLGGGGAVPGPDEDLVLAGAELGVELPQPPRPAAEVLEQLGASPRGAGVAGDVDPRDEPLAAREGVAAHAHRPGGHGGAVRRLEDVRVQRDLAEHDAAARARLLVGGEQPVGDGLEVARMRLGGRLDALQPLDRARADVARHDRPQRPAVHGRQRLPVHLPGEQDLGVLGLLQRDRGAERLRRVRLLRAVGADERDVRGARADAGGGEQVGEADAAPDRRPGRPGAPRRLARDGAHLGQAGPAVAGALERRGDLGQREEAGAQGGERELERALDEPADGESQRVRVERRHGPVVAHVEALDRGHGALGEGRPRRLGVERLEPVHHGVVRLAVAAHPGTVPAGPGPDPGRAARAPPRRLEMA